MKPPDKHERKARRRNSPAAAGGSQREPKQLERINREQYEQWIAGGKRGELVVVKRK